MIDLSRELARTAREFADSQSERIADVPAVRDFFATVTAVTIGGGPGGNALVKVTWRAVELTAASYNAAYTPVVGHRVRCSLIDNQLVIEGRYIN